MPMPEPPATSQSADQDSSGTTSLTSVASSPREDLLPADGLGDDRNDTRRYDYRRLCWLVGQIVADRRSDDGCEQTYQRPALAWFTEKETSSSSATDLCGQNYRTAYCDAKGPTTLCQPQSDHPTAIVEPAKRGLAHSSSPASGAVPM
jgi:hypothetical protein